jgi:hypothetical protein
MTASGLSANPDLATYRSIVRERWPDLDGEAWDRLACCGTVFRSIAALYWGTGGLKSEWASLWVDNMRLYEAERATALTRLGLTQDPRSAPERGRFPVSGAVGS